MFRLHYINGIFQHCHMQVTSCHSHTFAYQPFMIRPYKEHFCCVIVLRCPLSSFISSTTSSFDYIVKLSVK